MKKLFVMVLFLAMSILPAASTIAAQEVKVDGWQFPYLGPGRGHWDASVGVFVWKDTFEFRNLQLRADIDLGPGLRWHTVVRSNREQDTLKGFDPHCFLQVLFAESCKLKIQNVALWKIHSFAS